jgi:RNA polymerase sigma factor (TIGR02999 family)
MTGFNPCFRHEGLEWVPPSSFKAIISEQVHRTVETDGCGEVTLLLQQVTAGKRDAVDKLIPLVLGELQRVARYYLKYERPGHTLQPTALINEAYLRLIGDQARDWRNRAHFVGVTASIMRRILVDHARRRRAAKRDATAVSAYGIPSNLVGIQQDEDLIALSDALDRLENLSLRQRQVVEMRYFGGLSTEETAEALGVSVITVKRDWNAARAWLKSQLQPESRHPLT